MAESIHVIGTGCNSDGSTCNTGGPHWDGDTPFSRAEFNFVSYFEPNVEQDIR